MDYFNELVMKIDDIGKFLQDMKIQIGTLQSLVNYNRNYKDSHYCDKKQGKTSSPLLINIVFTDFVRVSFLLHVVTLPRILL